LQNSFLSEGGLLKTRTPTFVSIKCGQPLTIKKCQDDLGQPRCRDALREFTEPTPHFHAMEKPRPMSEKPGTPKNENPKLGFDANPGLRSATPMLTQRRHHIRIRRAALRSSIGGREPIRHFFIVRGGCHLDLISRCVWELQNSFLSEGGSLKTRFPPQRWLQGFVRHVLFLWILSSSQTRAPRELQNLFRPPSPLHLRLPAACNVAELLATAAVHGCKIHQDDNVGLLAAFGENWRWVSRNTIRNSDKLSPQHRRHGRADYHKCPAQPTPFPPRNKFPGSVEPVSLICNGWN
jgi:hypothetical protein